MSAPVFTCPACGYSFDDASSAMFSDDLSCIHEGAPMPEAGDYSICLRCAWLTVFTGNGLETRPLTDAEAIKANQNPELISTMRAMNRYYGEHPEARP